MKSKQGHERKNRDPRTPMSVTVKTIKGVKYTVKVFDEEAYAALIAQYYPECEPGAPGLSASAPTLPPIEKPGYSRSFRKRKPAARYAWANALSL